VRLFQPNDLSLARPEFVPLREPTVRDAVITALRVHWNHLGGESADIRGSIASGGRRANFRVRLGGRDHLLKSRAGSGAAARLSKEIELADRLLELGLPVPRSVVSAVGRPVSVLGETAWALYVFEEGSHFSGASGELDSASETFARFTLVSADLGLGGQNPREDMFLEHLPELLERAARGLSNRAVGRLSARHAPAILEALEATRAATNVAEARTAPVHLDYHPANLVMRDGKVACVLDMEDLKCYPVLAALGFAGYKLIREMLVGRSAQAVSEGSPGLVERWLGGWRRTFPGDEISAAHLRAGAEYRILALIELILDRDLNRGESELTYDLPKQIGSLYEVANVFGARLVTLDRLAN
jgi:Ser/Thr protein kinase RdoA (MazF antagonist)